MTEDEPILFFNDIKKPGIISIFATLKSAKELIAKNKKPYLRLVLIDPFSQERLVQIWSDHEIFDPLNIFMKKNLLKITNPIHLVKLSFDGEFISSTKQSAVNPIPTQHPVYNKYLQLNEYRLFRTIPDNKKVLNEIKKLAKIRPFIKSVIAKLEDYKIAITDEIKLEISKLLVDKTYTGTIYLIDGEKQLPISEDYSKYLLKQLEILLETFKQKIADDQLLQHIIIRRLQKDLISLYEFSKLTH